MSSIASSGLLSPALIRLRAHPVNKEDAIRQAAQMLIAAGCVRPGYDDSMIRREAVANTFLGHGVAIPHGMGEDRHLVMRNGVAILQVADGLEWNQGQGAHLIVAIAAQSDAHIAVLRRLTRLLQDQARLERLFTTDDPDDLVRALGEEAKSADAAAAAPAPAPAAPAVDFAQSFPWEVAYPAGLHARPASNWVDAARPFAARVRVRHEGQTADAKSLISLLQLGLRQGDAVVISADGQDAAAALARMKAVITGLTAQERADAARAAQRAQALPVGAWQPPDAPASIIGISAAPGVAIGTVRVQAAVDAAIADHPAPLAEGAALLTGLGVHELSVTPRDVAAVKARLRDSDLVTLQALARQALDCETAAEVRALEATIPAAGVAA